MIAALRAAETEHSGGQKGRGLGGRNFCPPSLSDSDFSAAAEFRASETGAPPLLFFRFKILHYKQILETSQIKIKLPCSVMPNRSI